MKNQVILSRTHVTFIRKSQDGSLSWVPDLSLATRFTIPEGAPLARQVGGTVVNVVAAEFMSQEQPTKKTR